MLLDRSRGLLRPAILCNGGPRQFAVRRTGSARAAIAPLTTNRTTTGFTASKLLRVAEREPRVFDRIATVLLPKDGRMLQLSMPIPQPAHPAAAEPEMD